MREQSDVSFWLNPNLKEEKYYVGSADNSISPHVAQGYAVFKVGICNCTVNWFIHGEPKEILRVCTDIVERLNAKLYDLKKEVKKLEDKNESGQEDKRSS